MSDPTCACGGVIDVPGEVEFRDNGGMHCLVIETRSEAHEFLGRTLRVQGRRFVVQNALRGPCAGHPDVERWLHVRGMELK